MAEFNLLSSSNSASESLAESKSGALGSKDSEGAKECLEQRVYYKLISGKASQDQFSEEDSRSID